MHRHFAILSLPWLLQSSWQVAALSLPPEGLEVGLASRQHHHQDQPSSLAHDHLTHSNSSIPHLPSHDAHSSHHHSGPVLVNLNETAIEVQHGPQLPSYLTRDFNITVPRPLLPEHQEEWQALQAIVTGGEAKPWLMGIHVATMTLAFFGALPIALALRAAHHSSHHAIHGAFVVLSTLGWAAGAAYKARTPDLYPGSVHSSQGRILLLLCIILTALDYLRLLQRGLAYFPSCEPRSVMDLWRALRSKTADVGNEYVSVRPSQELPVRRRRSSDETATDEPTGEIMFTSPFAAQYKPQQQLPAIVTSSSPVSEPTVYGSPCEGDIHKRTVHWDADEETIPRWAANVTESKFWRGTLRRSAATMCTISRRLVVLGAYVVTITGLATYIGFGRGNYINTCLAHVIKGSIFFLYGLITFSRYIGAFADRGWAWNAPPEGYAGISAEMVECFVVFLYGATNTWMERFGAAPGSPYTIKQIQHISIAVMYWFAGLAGIILESKRARRLLSGMLFGRTSSVEASPASLNPLPAIVIGVTGIAMAAHHQDYQFQVSIHSLWGILLAGGSVFRCLTYFSLWVQYAKTSMDPSRPPAELLAAFGYAAGGIIFMLSNEEVAFAAMRAGYGDMMAFLNLTIALVSFVFCWILIVLTVKGWATFRAAQR